MGFYKESLWRPNNFMITPYGINGKGIDMAALNMSAPTDVAMANSLLFFPITIDAPFYVTRMFHYQGAAAATSTLRFGIWDENLVELYDSGSTWATGAANSFEERTPNITLEPGRYYLGILQSESGSTLRHANDMLFRSLGSGYNNSGLFDSPSIGDTATVRYMALCGISGRTLI